MDEVDHPIFPFNRNLQNAYLYLPLIFKSMEVDAFQRFYFRLHIASKHQRNFLAIKDIKM
jgi:hypothetical protein